MVQSPEANVKTRLPLDPKLDFPAAPSLIKDDLDDKLLVVWVHCFQVLCQELVPLLPRCTGQHMVGSSLHRPSRH